ARPSTALPLPRSERGRACPPFPRTSHRLSGCAALPERDPRRSTADSRCSGRECSCQQPSRCLLHLLGIIEPVLVEEWLDLLPDNAAVPILVHLVLFAQRYEVTVPDLESPSKVGIASDTLVQITK